MEEENQDLSPRERKKLRKQESETMKLPVGRIILLVAIAVVAFLGYKAYSSFSKPLPGELLEDLGREHVPDGTVVEYNSNPPTSGPHFADWTRAGIYEKPISDGHLIHSLEHGYVIISYNCEGLEDTSFSLVKTVYAHEEELELESEDGEEGDQSQEESVELETGIWSSQNCQNLKNKLSDFYNKTGEKKLILIPRPGLDSRIALTAWRRILKLAEVEEEKMTEFVNQYRDRGPERTME